MNAGNTITITGNITSELELSITEAGQAVVNFSVAYSTRYFDKTARAWKDGKTSYVRCTVWRQMAENAVNSLTKGSRITVIGKLEQRPWQTKEGQQRVSTEMTVEELAVSLKFATAAITKNVKASVPAETAPAEPVAEQTEAAEPVKKPRARKTAAPADAKTPAAKKAGAARKTAAPVPA